MVTIEAGEQITLTSTARDSRGKVITGRITQWDIADPSVATMSSDGVLTAKYAVNTQITARVDGRSTVVPVEIIPRITEVVPSQFLWPVDRRKDSAGLVSQDYAEIRDVSDLRFHAGLDIRADAGTPVVSVASGWLEAVQLMQTKTASAVGDHGLGNTVIVGHRTALSEVTYTQYSHLQHISLIEYDLNDHPLDLSVNHDSIDATLRNVLQAACTKDQPSTNSTLKIPDRWRCDEGAIPIQSDAQRLTLIGYSGSTFNGLTGQCADSQSSDYFCAHLHFEVKDTAFVGSGPASHDPDPGEWGYTTNLPSDEGYHDPVNYFSEVASFSPPYRIVTPTSDGAVRDDPANSVSLRMGPGGHVQTFIVSGAEDTWVNAAYRDISYLRPGEFYYETAFAEQPPGLFSPALCDQGWSRLRRITNDPNWTDGTAPPKDPLLFFDEHITIVNGISTPDGGEIEDAWACRGHDTTSYLQDYVDSTAPSAPTNVNATFVPDDIVSLTWDESFDLVGFVTVPVDAYRVIRNGVEIAVTSINSYTDGGLNPFGTYCYEVSAVDNAGIISTLSVPDANNSNCATISGGSPLQVTLSPMVDSTGPFPPGLVYIQDAAIDENNVALIGSAPDNRWGIYRILGQSAPEVVVDSGSVSPSINSTYGSFHTVDITGSRVYFSSQLGIYYQDPSGAPAIVADFGTLSPPEETDPFGRGFVNYRGAESFVAQNGGVVFHSSYAIYYSDLVQLYRVADTDTVVTAGFGNLNSLFEDLRLVAGTVAFTAGTSTTSGVYSWRSDVPLQALIELSNSDGSYSNIALDGERTVYKVSNFPDQPRLVSLRGGVEESPDIIDSSASFLGPTPGNVEGVYAANGRIAFMTRGNNSQVLGIYVEESGIFTKVLENNSVLDQQQISHIEIVDFNGDSVFIVMDMSGGGQALYRADLQ